MERAFFEKILKAMRLIWRKRQKEKGVKLLIPIDTVVADGFSNDAHFHTVDRGGIKPDEEALISEKDLQALCRRN